MSRDSARLSFTSSPPSAATISATCVESTFFTTVARLRGRGCLQATGRPARTHAPFDGDGLHLNRLVLKALDDGLVYRLLHGRLEHDVHLRALTVRVVLHRAPGTEASSVVRSDVAMKRSSES